VGLRSTPARYIFLDEVDAYPASADEEGDPVSLAEARSLTFAHRRKVFLVSTPTIRGLSRIEREFEASDQRRYHLPCPHCGHVQWLKFERLRWDKGRPENAEYHCEGCDTPIAEHHKTAMLEAGEWRATAEPEDPGTVGYHLSALYSPVGWLGWARIARAHEAARGSDEAMRAFRNTVLGETWMETGEAPDWQRLAERREAWASGTVPAGGLFLTAGADVQKDRIEVDVWAWGRGLESWLVDHIIIEGGPGDPDCWQTLTDLLGRTWAHASGQHLTIARFAIDSGFETSAVYGWARQVGFAQVAPVKGARGLQPGKPGDGSDLCRRNGGREALAARRAAVECGDLDLQGRDISLSEAGAADGGGYRGRGILPGGNRPPAVMGGRRMAETADGRTTGDRQKQAGVHQARMAEAARTQRGAGLSGVCAGRRLDCGGRPLARGPMGGSGKPAWGGENGRDRRRGQRCTAISGSDGTAAADDAVKLHGVIRWISAGSIS